MKKKSEFYSRTGDDGTTGLLGEGRVNKYDLRMEALGTLDELSAALGLARSFMHDAGQNEMVIHLQRQLYELMAEVAASKDNAEKMQRITPEVVCSLESEIDQISSMLETPDGFIIPGATSASAAIALCRTITRRAERRVAELLANGEVRNKDLLIYLNRLSSLFFVMELDLIQQIQQKPVMAKQRKK